MRILAIGDVTSEGGVAHLEANLWRVRDREKIDLAIVNAENASFITGASAEMAERLLSAGADCLTGGNHTMRNTSVYSYLDSSERMLRPINFGSEAAGQGYTILDVGGWRVMVINVMGTVHIDPVLDSPFPAVERALEREAGRYDIALLDIHAEATGEKLAIAYAFDGKISAIWGTHTHVPTADEQILPHGTGYVTDLGMCGESGGILGMRQDKVVERMRTRLPIKFMVASGKPRATGCIFDIDEHTGKARDVKRIAF